MRSWREMLHDWSGKIGHDEIDLCVVAYGGVEIVGGAEARSAVEAKIERLRAEDGLLNLAIAQQVLAERFRAPRRLRVWTEIEIAPVPLPKPVAGVN